jgi:hypothetical protein
VPKRTPKAAAVANAAKLQPLHVVMFDSPHFTFIAAGINEEHARDALAEGWKEHVRQTGADPAYLNPTADGHVFKLWPGQCWRDDARIWPPTSRQSDRPEHYRTGEWK